MLQGTLYLMLANGVFALSSYIIHFWLGRYLGPADYGTFGVVLALMTTFNLVITSGIPQSASKYIAEDFSRAGDIIKDANKVQLVFCALIFALYLGLAGFIANMLNDTALTPYIRISALAIPAYALYSIYNAGYLNGLRKFSRQSISTIGASLAKVAATFVLVLVGLGVNGAIIGYMASALIGFLLAWRFLGTARRSKADFGWKKLAGFGIPATAFAGAFFLLMSIDLFAVKAIGGGEAEVGYYTSASTISRMLYTLFTGLAASLLPSISRSMSSDDAGLTKRYIQQSMRYMLMLLIPAVFLISATSGDLLTLVYSSRYIEAANSLSILVFGLGFLSVFLVLANIIMGTGKPLVVLLIALPLVGIDIGLNVFLIPAYGLNGAAWATTITGFLGMCATAVYVLRRFEVLIAPRSLGRIFLASLVIFVITLQVSFLAIWLPLIYAGLTILYGGMLWIMRELKSEDWKTFKKLMPMERFTGREDLNI